MEIGGLRFEIMACSVFGNATCCFPTIGQSSYVVSPGAQSNPSIKIWVFVVSKSFKHQSVKIDESNESWVEVCRRSSKIKSSLRKAKYESDC
jgi:hypothetical protein